MTITYTSNAKSYTGDGLSLAFATVMRFFDNSHIVVAVQALPPAGPVATMVEGVDYTLTGAGDLGGGTVLFYLAPVAGAIVTLTRVVPLWQQTDYVEYDAFPADATENALDYLTMICQQLAQQVTDIATNVGGGTTAANIPGSGVGVYAYQAGNVLNFKKLIGGTNVFLGDTGDEVTISVLAPGIAYPGTTHQFLRGDGLFTSDLVQTTFGNPGLSITMIDPSSPYMLRFVDTNAGPDQHNWSVRAFGGFFNLHAADDLNNVSDGVIGAFRAGGARLDAVYVGLPYNVSDQVRVALGAGANLDDGVSDVLMAGSVVFLTKPGSPIGPRISGDLGAPTIAQRLCFQTSVPNGQSAFNIIPNGTNTVAAIVLTNKSDPDNAGITVLGCGGIPTLRNVPFGTGIAEDITFYVAGALTRLTIKQNSGRVILGGNTDDGVNGVQVQTGQNLNLQNGALRIANTKVVGARDTGWATMTGTGNKASVYDTATVTTAQLAGRVKQLQDMLAAHGLIG